MANQTVVPTTQSIASNNPTNSTHREKVIHSGKCGRVSLLLLSRPRFLPSANRLKVVYLLQPYLVVAELQSDITSQQALWNSSPQISTKNTLHMHNLEIT